MPSRRGGRGRVEDVQESKVSVDLYTTVAQPFTGFENVALNE